ncbi:cobalamin B12-binding domain-containing protein [Ornithinimicrobium faecis]|uniref:cobalamin B12-binding domain-containing protein n=1 Tax=Ornithinimicrobium faecis TaxID=2934158 RepID=UPI00211968D4|nr:cobalamin B12-binding domain-containing protein [Ornithinimicrobium sp. HY1745]
MAPKRVLVAKPGLDGHDRGAKVVARILRDAGYEVIYTGIRQKPSEVAAIAAAEDVDLIGISVLSGAHMGLTRRLLEALADVQADDIPVVVGGTIPSNHRARLLELGAAAVFPTGSASSDIVDGVREVLERAESAERDNAGV